MDFRSRLKFVNIKNMIINSTMEETSNMLESLIEKATVYSQTSFSLVKLKALDKTTEVVSTLIPYLVVLLFFMLFMLFLNIGLAFWIGGIFGNIGYGFFVLAAFYGFAGIFIRLFLYRWIKKTAGNNFINQLLK